MNQYAARCPNWQRNCVNATPPPAQVSSDSPTDCIPLIIPQWWKKKPILTLFKKNLIPKATVRAAMLSSQFWRKGWDWKLVLRTGNIFSPHAMYNFVISFCGPWFPHDVSLCCRGTAVTVATASVPDAVLLRSWDPAWGQRVRKRKHVYNHNFAQTDWWWSLLPSLTVSFSAPEAQRETVFVCAACNSSLIKLQWGGMLDLSRSSQQEFIHCSPSWAISLKPKPTCLGFSW